MPNSLLRRKYEATFALWMMFLLGRHAIFGHDPPIYLRSMTATRLPSAAKVQAAIVEPVPPPRITTSNSSGCGFLYIAMSIVLGIWVNGAFSVVFIADFLRVTSSPLALIG